MKLSEKNKWLNVEMVEHLSWAFVAYLIGIIISYDWTVNLYFIAGLIFASGMACFCSRKNLIFLWISIICLFCLLGIFNIQFHIRLNQHSVLTKPLYKTPVQATVLENRFLMEKQIVTLNEIRWQNPDLKMPQKIRLYFKQNDPLLEKGDKIKALVSVYPPDNTFLPEFSRRLWFDKIGATGIINQIKIQEKVRGQPTSFEKIRQYINTRLFDSFSHSHADVMAALITGENKLVHRDTYQLYRRAGIAHVLSVSGFHMALLSGFLFFLIRSICALFPRIALYFNTRKMAALLAFIGTFLYLGISGFQIPAIRAFLMISLVFCGIFVDRPVLSTRSLILVGFTVLLFSPQKLFSVSFQLSFMAVAVLVFICNKIQNQPWSKIRKLIIGFTALNILVFLGLAPFILYHFHQFMPYGILGNMLFSGIFSFVIMPLLFIGCLLMPFGLDRFFFYLSDLGLDIVHSGIEKLAHFPYAEIAVNGFSLFSLITISFGIILFCLMKTPLRWISFIFIGLGILKMFFP